MMAFEQFTAQRRRRDRAF